MPLTDTFSSIYTQVYEHREKSQMDENKNEVLPNQTPSEIVNFLPKKRPYSGFANPSFEIMISFSKKYRTTLRRGSI